MPPPRGCNDHLYSVATLEKFDSESYQDDELTGLYQSIPAPADLISSINSEDIHVH